VSGHEVKKMVNGGVGGEGKNTSPPLSAPTLYQSNIQLQSKMAALKTWFIERSVPNVCLHCRPFILKKNHAMD